jgi:hypothetical protein
MSAAKITASIEKAINTQIQTGVMNAAMRVVGATVNDLARKRSLSGINNKGQRMPGYKASYAKKKRDMIKGKVKLPGRRTPFAAKNVEDYGALTGRTFSDMTVKDTGVKETKGKLTGEVVTDFRSDRSRKVANALEKKGRGITGLAPANTSQGRKERAEIARVVKGVTRLPNNRTIDIDSRAVK